MERFAADNGNPDSRDDGDGAAPSRSRRRTRSIAQTLSRAEWIRVTGKSPGGMQLSPQQGDIVRLMMTLPWDANSNQGIARALGVKPSTVAKQLKRVFKRLGVHSRMELAMRVIDEIAVMRGWMNP